MEASVDVKDFYSIHSFFLSFFLAASSRSIADYQLREIMREREKKSYGFAWKNGKKFPSSEYIRYISIMIFVIFILAKRARLLYEG